LGKRLTVPFSVIGIFYLLVCFKEIFFRQSRNIYPVTLDTNSSKYSLLPKLQQPDHAFGKYRMICMRISHQHFSRAMVANTDGKLHTPNISVAGTTTTTTKKGSKTCKEHA